MSVRAYKILEVEKEPSFNLWHDDDLLDFFRSTGEFSDGTDGNSETCVSVKTIKLALKKKSLWEDDDYRPKQLKKDIKGLDDDDWVSYVCY